MRTSPIYYIEPSAISIIANANESSQDLAVNVDRGTKIKVCYQPIAGLGYNNANYKEWSFRGRNRRLKEADKPYTIYARLNKTNQTDGYLVFAEQVVDQETGEWTDPYILSPNTSATSPIRLEGADGEKYMWGAIPERQAADRRSGYWWVKLGTVSLPGEDGRRTVDLDTGILGTVQYNADWYLDPDKMPKRPVRVIPVERGNWSPAPTVTYTGESGSATPDGTLSIAIADELGWNGTIKISVTQGQRISEPYHYSHLTRNRWLTHRLAEYNSGLTDAELYEKLTTASRGWEEENWLETSRVWHGGRLWECLTEGTASEPGDDNPDWQLLLHSGVDGSGIEFIYYLGTTNPATGQTPAPSTPASSGNGTVNGEVTAYTPYIDDWVPEGWTDSPQGISFENQIEWISQRTSSPTNGDDNGGHQWSGFSRPEIWSKWGRNGQDGDGVEYVYVRTKDDTAPVISDSSDTYEDKTYLDDDYLPLTSAGRATDNPKGTTRDWPYEWVIKRTKGPADPETGERTWEKYAGEMKMWSTYAAMRLSIDNPMAMVPTDSDGKILADFTVETTVRLYDGAKEVAIDAALIEVTGAPGADIATQHTEAQGNGLRMMWTFVQGRTMADTYGISITYTYNKTIYYGVFTIAASKNTAVWQLKPDKTTVVFRRNGDNSLTPVSHAVGLVLIRIDSSGSAEFAQVQDGMYVRYSAVAMPQSPSDGAAWTSGDITIYNTDDNLFIALFGSNGALLDRKTVAVVRDGAAGNAYEVSCSANSFILNQQEYEPYEIEVAGAETTIDVTLDGVQQSWRIVSVSYDVDVYNGAGTYGYNEIMTSWSGVAGVGAKTVGVTYVKNNIKQAHLLITIEYGQGQQRTLRIIIACNLLGSWKQKIIGDAEKVWAEKSTYTYTDDDGVEHTITLQEFYANYTRSSSENSAKFREIVSVLNTDGEGTTPDDVTEENYAQYLQSAREAYSQIQKDIYNDDGSIATKLAKYVLTDDFIGLFAKKILKDPEGTATLEGYVQATAESVSLGVVDTNNENIKQRTGIDITRGLIRLNDKTVIEGSLNVVDDGAGFSLIGSTGTTNITRKSVGTYEEWQQQTTATKVASGSAEGSPDPDWIQFVIEIPFTIDMPGTVVFRSHTINFAKTSGSVLQKPQRGTVEYEVDGHSVTEWSTLSDNPGSCSITLNSIGSHTLTIVVTAYDIASAGWTWAYNEERVAECYFSCLIDYPTANLVQIGYDGIAMNYGTNKNIYLAAENTTFRYGNIGFRIDSTGVWVASKLNDSGDLLWTQFIKPDESGGVSVSWNNISDKPKYVFAVKIGSTKKEAESTSGSTLEFTFDDIGAMAKTEKFGKSIALSSDSKKLLLKDQDGTLLSEVNMPSLSGDYIPLEGSSLITGSLVPKNSGSINLGAESYPWYDIFVSKRVFIGGQYLDTDKGYLRWKQEVLLTEKSATNTFARDVFVEEYDGKYYVGVKIGDYEIIEYDKAHELPAGGSGGSSGGGISSIVAEVGSHVSTPGIPSVSANTVNGVTILTFDYLKGSPGERGKSLEFNWYGTNLGVRREGDSSYSYQNLKGTDGKGLEFNWSGTSLGVRREGDSSYSYQNLGADTSNCVTTDTESTQYVKSMLVSTYGELAVYRTSGRSNERFSLLWSGSGNTYSGNRGLYDESTGSWTMLFKYSSSVGYNTNLGSNGPVFIGSTDFTVSNYKLGVQGSAWASGSFVNGSDIRRKNVLAYLSPDIAEIAELPVIRYTWKDLDDNKEHLGTIAQSVMNVMPELVYGDDNLGLDYGALGVVSAITAAREIVALKKEVAEKDAMIKNLERDLAAERERRDNIEQRLKRVEELLLDMINHKS